MSNPGVRYLFNKNLTNGVNFRVEDNIGEAIHLHYGDELRVDLSIREFFALSDGVRSALSDLLSEKGLNLNWLDRDFASLISPYLVDLDYVEIEKVKLKDLQVAIRKGFRYPVFCQIGLSHIVGALRGNRKALKQYLSENNHESSYGNAHLDELFQKIKEDGYPLDGRYIVLFNNQNIIRDGQHRAACLYVLYGEDYELPILRLHFKNERYSISKWLWIKNALHVDRNTIRKIYRGAFHILRKIKNRWIHR